MSEVRIQPECIPEREAFPALTDLAARLACGDLPEGSGHWDEIEPPATVAGRAAGDVVLVHIHDAVLWPKRGIVLGRDGYMVQSTFEGAAIARSDMVRLRGVKLKPDGMYFAAPVAMRRLSRAMVWMNAGAKANYGHFLFDALPPLFWADQAGLTPRFPPVSPMLTRWQRDLVERAGIETTLQQISDEVVGVDHLILTTAQNHYLHRNAGLLQALGNQLRGAARGLGAPVYLSRRGQTGRIITNEAALEKALAERGVEILRPGWMTVASQAAAVSESRAIVGPSGAALANLLFAARGSRVVEIRPFPVVEPWIDLACTNMEIEHRVVAAPGPLPLSEVPFWVRVHQLPRRLTGRYHYACRVDIEAVLSGLE